MLLIDPLNVFFEMLCRNCACIADTITTHSKKYFCAGSEFDLVRQYGAKSIK